MFSSTAGVKCPKREEHSYGNVLPPLVYATGYRMHGAGASLPRGMVTHRNVTQPQPDGPPFLASRYVEVHKTDARK